MNVSSIAAPQTARTPLPSAASEAAENPSVPDHDGDSDDVAAAQPAPRAALPSGVGQAVDKTT